MIEDVSVARTFLFVPGHRPNLFSKAASSGADIVVLDLEDAVGPERKHEAREHVRAWLDERRTAAVRINAVGTPWHDADVGMVAGRADAVMVPKAEEPALLESLGRRLPAGTAIIPLIETAAGIMRAAHLCAAPLVARPAFGSVDLAAQLGIDHQAVTALQYARSALVLAAAAAGCAAPIDGVTTALGDSSALQADLEHAVTLGFAGKLCIHPAQVALANQRFTPSDEEIGWARGVVAAAQDGSVAVHNGQMIDRPVVLRAQSILARARDAGAGRRR